MKGFIQIGNDLLRVDSIVSVIDEQGYSFHGCRISMSDGKTYCPRNTSAFEVKKMMEDAQ